jgi:ABC-type taurine transport system substrate-binding protein
LQKKGVDLNCVHIVMVPFAEQKDQLDAGRIDGALSAPPFYIPLLNSGYRILVDATADATQQPIGDPKAVSVNAFFVASDNLAQAHPEVYKAFRKSLSAGRRLDEGQSGFAHAAAAVGCNSRRTLRRYHPSLSMPPGNAPATPSRITILKHGAR